MIRWWDRGSAHLLPDVLPVLSGWRLKAYSLVWGAMLILALLMACVGAWKGYTPMQYGWLNYGLSGSSDRRQIMTVIGDEAIRSGIAVGDSVVSIDGTPIEHIGDNWLSLRDALARPEGETIALTLQNAAGEVITHRLTSSAANTAVRERVRKASAASALLAQLALMAAAVLLFRRRREPVPAVLALSFVMLSSTASSDAMLWLDHMLVQQLLIASSLSLMLFGLLVFPDGRLASRSSRLIALGIVGWGLSLLLVAAHTAAQIFAFGLVVLFAVVGVRLIARYRRMETGNERQQVRWATLGFTVGIFFYAVGTVSHFAATQLGGKSYGPLALTSSATALLGTVCLVGGLLISLMRYRLYDADAVVGRSATFGVLTLGFIGVFAGSQKAIEALGENYFGDQVGALAGALGAALAAVVIVPLHRRVNDWAERRFQKGLLRLRRGLPRLVGDLREIAPPNRIAETVADVAMVGVQATRAAVLIGDTLVAARGVASESVIDWLADIDIESASGNDGRRDPLFPMRLPLDAEGIGRVGWLLLGPRPDGSFHGKDERSALAEIAEPVARSLAIAGLREREKGEMRATFERLETRIHALEKWAPQQPGAPALA